MDPQTKLILDLQFQLNVYKAYANDLQHKLEYQKHVTDELLKRHLYLIMQHQELIQNVRTAVLPSQSTEMNTEQSESHHPVR